MVKNDIKSGIKDINITPTNFYDNLDQNVTADGFS